MVGGKESGGVRKTDRERETGREIQSERKKLSGNGREKERG